MGSVKNIRYRDVQIVYNDMSEARPSEIFDLCFQCEELLKTFPEKEALLLINIKNIRFNSQVINKMKETALKNKPFVKDTAVFGVEGFTRAICDIISNYSGRKMKRVEGLEEGMAWLYRQANPVEEVSPAAETSDLAT